MIKNETAKTTHYHPIIQVLQKVNEEMLSINLLCFLSILLSMQVSTLLLNMFMYITSTWYSLKNCALLNKNCALLNKNCTILLNTNCTLLLNTKDKDLNKV